MWVWKCSILLVVCRSGFVWSITQDFERSSMHISLQNCTKWRAHLHLKSIHELRWMLCVRCVKCWGMAKAWDGWGGLHANMFWNTYQYPKLYHHHFIPNHFVMPSWCPTIVYTNKHQSYPSIHGHIILYIYIYAYQYIYIYLYCILYIYTDTYIRMQNCGH